MKKIKLTEKTLPLSFWSRFQFKRYSVVKHVRRSYTGGEKHAWALIIGFTIYETHPGHTAFDQYGYTSELIYRVRYPDGSENVLWPEECEAIA